MMKKIMAAILCFLLGGCFFLPMARAEQYSQVLPSSQMAELAKAGLEEELQNIGETRRHEIVLMRAPKNLLHPYGEITCEVSFPKRIEYGTLIPAHINVFLDGKHFRRTICYFRLKVYEQVLVAKKDLFLEHPIGSDDVHLEEVELVHRGADYLTNMQDAIGQVPARAIRSGTLLTKRMLQTPVVIDVGASVTMIAEHHGVRVSMEGVAMERGRIGRVIRVRNAVSRKVLRGRVVDASTVELIS